MISVEGPDNFNINGTQGVLPINSGSYSWTIGSDSSPELPSTGHYKISILCTFANGQNCESNINQNEAYSSGLFTIGTPNSTTPTITVTNPQAGETWDGGGSYNVSWTSQNLTGEANVMLCLASSYNPNYPSSACIPVVSGTTTPITNDSATVTIPAGTNNGNGTQVYIMVSSSQNMNTYGISGTFTVDNLNLIDFKG